MTIFSDAAGFKYFGDCQWGTLNIDYPTQYYLEALPTANIDTARPGISTALTNLCTQSGLAFRNVATQATFDARVGTVNGQHFLWFGANGDIDDRYSFGVRSWITGTSNDSNVNIFNDTGSTSTDPTANPNSVSTNRLYYLGPNGLNSSANVNIATTPSGTVSPLYWVGASDGQYLALFLYQRNWGGDAARSSFFYAGQLANVNTGFNYYSASNTTKTISFCQIGGTSVSVAVTGGHYITNTAKATLQTGDAAYSIVCSDSQTPTSQWATDMYVFDNNTTLGFPAMGQVRGLLLGTGTYTLGKPVKIQGSVFPDGGSQWVIPVGTYAGKTLLMRCYSSMT